MKKIMINTNSQIKLKNTMLKSKLCDDSDVYTHLYTYKYLYTCLGFWFFDFSYFLGKSFFYWWFANMFPYHTNLKILESKERKGTKHIVAWKSKTQFKYSFHQLYTAFLPNIKHFGYKI